MCRKKGKSLTQEIRDWLSVTWGNISVTNFYLAQQIVTSKEKAKCRVVFSRMVKEGLIERIPEKDGWYRRIDNNYERMEFIKAETEAVDLKLLFGIEKFVEIMPGNIILISGEQNAGKTAFLLNIIRQNMNKHEIYYFNSEMGAPELMKRLLKFDDICLNEWKFEAYERTENFADVIKPGKGKINIIDFLEMHDNFYEVGGKLTAIHKKLDGAIAIVALQKNPNTDVGLGVYRSLEKPRLALAMSPGKLKIVKAKNWKSPENPNGKEINFKIVQGCKFISEWVWKR